MRPHHTAEGDRPSGGDGTAMGQGGADVKDIKEEIERAMLKMRKEEMEKAIEEGREREILNEFAEVVGGAWETLIDGVRNPDLEKALKEGYVEGMIEDIKAEKIAVPEDMREAVAGAVLRYKLDKAKEKH